MDNQPKTRREQKPGKYKPVFNQKTIRLKEALAKKPVKREKVTG